jgi:hypothetical protein
MSGAAAIAAAKNRRGKSDPNQKQLPPPISCGKNGNGSCPPQNKSGQISNSSKSVTASQKPSELVDPTSLQILGPMPPVQILRLHEQRLNKFDERLNQLSTFTPSCQTDCQPIASIDESELDDCFTRIETLESKLSMLEEVIITLQNKLTIAQNFAMETNMSMTALIKKQELLQSQQTQQTQLNAVMDITSSFSEDSDKLASDQSSSITLEIIDSTSI